jgi:hypothetical protein
VSQNDSRTLHSFRLADCSENGHCPHSHGDCEGQTHAESTPEARHGSHLKRTVTPKRSPNADLRTREHLTEAEVQRLMDAARKNPWGHRDATMVLVAYCHGLRPAELVDLRWDQIDFASGVLHVRRVKRGAPSTHPILGDDCEPCGAFSANRSPSHPSCSRRSAERPSVPQGSLA